MIESGQRRRARGDTTRVAIIEAAEKLFAMHGVYGASLRQIGTASGSANTNVVAYHFGDREALVAAIIRHRLPGIEAIRLRMLRGRNKDALSLRDLLIILFEPLFQQCNAAGELSYAAFLAGLFRSGDAWKRYSFGEDYPATARIIDMIRDRLGISGRLFRARMQICTHMIVSSLDLIQQADMGVDDDEARRFSDILAMAEGALTAPSA